MPLPDEKERRRAIKNAMQQAERDEIRSSLPLAPALMRELFDFVDQELSQEECDDQLSKTLNFLERRGLAKDTVVTWLQGAGGYCDCEVLANAEEKFLFAFPENAPETEE